MAKKAYFAIKFTLLSRTFLLLHKNAKETDPKHLSNFNCILCGDFGEKKFGCTLKDEDRVTRQSSGVAPVVAPHENFQSPF